MIDLHSHTTASDGTFTPRQLVDEAVRVGLEALAITDHDTFEGYDAALPLAQEAGLDLVCGIELSTKLRGKTVHLLGYWVKQAPAASIRNWLTELQESRRDRNRRMVKRLQSLNVAITIEEVETLGGRLAGRPHFAKILLDKGYVQTLQQAFDDFLDESAKGYVDRLEPQLSEGIRMIRDAGGIASIAHPVRLARNAKMTFEQQLEEMHRMELDAIEVYHSDHGHADTLEYFSLAQRFGLFMTGGSDFHGAAKPKIQLGVGPGNLAIPKSLLDTLRAA